MFCQVYTDGAKTKSNFGDFVEKKELNEFFIALLHCEIEFETTINIDVDDGKFIYIKIRNHYEDRAFMKLEEIIKSIKEITVH